MKIWVDDMRPAPDGYIHCRSVNQVKKLIEEFDTIIECALDEWDFPPDDLWNEKIDVIDLDHDAGEYSIDGGDYVNILNWLEETGRSYPIRIHSMNPVGVENMRRIIQHNRWKEIR